MKVKVKEMEQKAKGSKKEMKELDKLHERYTHLMNKRKECVIALRKKYKIKVDVVHLG